MQIGIPREVKDGEARVGATPGMVRALVEQGHGVRVERGAGARSGFPDRDYLEAGARIVEGPEAVFACPLVAKVKELQREEYTRLQPGTVVAGYQQLARDPALLEAVLRAGVTCLAYEGVTLPDGSRPMLAPMSLLAGLMSAQITAWALQYREGPLSGSGILLAGPEGVPPARVLILGDGVVGRSAAEAFLRAGSEVTLLGVDGAKLEALKARFGPGLHTALSSPEEVARWLPQANVVVGAVSIPGKLAPKLITRTMLRAMQPGSLILDIGIDMGGVAETSRQTKLSDPLFVEEGILHYGVPNIPAQAPRAATQVLGAATLPYLEIVAGLGLEGALRARPELATGVLVHGGQVVNQALAEDCQRPFAPLLTSTPSSEGHP